MAHGCALSSDAQRARAISSKLQKRAATEYVSSYDIALIYLGLNDREQALNWLNRAYKEGDPNMNSLNVDPTLGNLRSETRFRELLERIGLNP